MGITSAAEARLDARIRPEIAVLRSRTPYPGRARGRAAGGPAPALAVLRGGAEAGQDVAQACAVAEARAVAEGRGGGTVVAAAAVTAAGAIAVARSVIASPAAGAGPTADEGGCVAGAAAARVSRPDAPSRPGGVRTQARPPGLRAAELRPVRPRQAVTAAPVRLTRRGRIVIGALVALAVAGLTALIWLAIAGQAEAAGPGGLRAGAAAGHTMTRVVVRPGDTLWSIVVRVDPTADPRAVIQEIIDDNALRGTAIQAGQVLYIPRT